MRSAAPFLPTESKMSGQAMKGAPPAFGGDKSYERWKTELEAWQLVTATEKKKQAISVALSFPEGSEVRDSF